MFCRTLLSPTPAPPRPTDAQPDPHPGNYIPRDHILCPCFLVVLDPLVPSLLTAQGNKVSRGLCLASHLVTGASFIHGSFRAVDFHLLASLLNLATHRPTHPRINPQRLTYPLLIDFHPSAFYAPANTHKAALICSRPPPWSVQLLCRAFPPFRAHLRIRPSYFAAVGRAPTTALNL